MTFLSRASMMLTFFFLIFLSSFGQVNLFNANDLSGVRIDDFSNEEIESFYKKAAETGLSEGQIYSLLAQKGLNQTEINKLRSRLQTITKSSLSTRATSDYKDTSSLDESRFDTSLGKIPLQSILSDKKANIIFGSELFSTNTLIFEPNLRIPAPTNYTLGPDDEIIISVFGYSEKKYTLKIDESGEIYIPNVGPVLISGLTMEQASFKIKNKLASTIYNAIKTGQTQVQVSLGKIRSIRVTVIGQAKKPGTYTVSSLTTLYNILYLCGGPTEMGSYRKIEVIRNSGNLTADLYDFLVYGNQNKNVLLHEGDVIRIPYYENRITLSGNVKREGKYEMLADETFEDILKYSGGFTDDAYRGSVTIERITDSERKLIDLPSASFGSFSIKGSDKYTVRKLQDEFGNRIYVSGAIQRQGPYELTEEMNVSDLIRKAGGLSADAYTDRALLYRYQTNKLPEMRSINLDSVMNFGQKILLQNNDSLVISSIFSLRDREVVEVNGNVRAPGMFSWRKSMTLKDLILLSGGITASGDSTNVEVSRRISNAKIDEANHIESQILTINLSEQSASDIFLYPFDIINIKVKPGYNTQRTVLVQGEVLSSGIYTLEKSEERITDIISRTNGFKASADSNSLIIRRIKKSISNSEEHKKIFERILTFNSDSIENNEAFKKDLFKDYDLISVDLKRILQNPQSLENLPLEDGDILTIERAANLVKVSGAVYFPTIVPYTPNKTLKYYVQQAGNFMPQSRKTGALVIHPNGKVASVKQFLFFKSYPKVTSRSEIFVPRKDQSSRTRMSAAEWAVVVSALGIVSNVIINLTK